MARGMTPSSIHGAAISNVVPPVQGTLERMVATSVSRMTLPSSPQVRSSRPCARAAATTAAAVAAHEGRIVELEHALVHGIVDFIEADTEEARQKHAQPLISVVLNLFALPVQAGDMILHRRLDRVEVRRAHDEAPDEQDQRLVGLRELGPKLAKRTRHDWRSARARARYGSTSPRRLAL